MIIQTLNRYYHILLEDKTSQIPSYGYCNAKVGYALIISEDGELVDVLPLEEVNDKNKYLPKTLIVPERRIRTDISANFMCDKSIYILGIDKNSKPQRLKKAFEAFKKLHFKVLNSASGRAAKAILAFLDKWDISFARKNIILQKYIDGILKERNIVFRLDGEMGYLHDDPEIKKLWEMYNTNNENGIEGQCLVTGEKTIISRLHPKITNIKGTFPGGAPLVSFNDSAYESYGKTQSYNSPIGQNVTFSYSTALNHILSNKKQKIQIGDITTVFWSESPQSIITDFTVALLNPYHYKNEKVDNNIYKQDTRIESLVKDVLVRVKSGMRIDSFFVELDPKTKFYILGLSPNKARIAVRFFYSDTFGGFVEKVAQHYKDMELVKDFSYKLDNIPIRMILNETVSKKSREKKVMPLLAGAVMRSIVSGSLYPVSLFNAVMIRIKTDMDDKDNNTNRLNYTRVSIIKAYLLRKARIQNNKNLKEVLSVSLNEETTNVEYLLGRLFAVLEKAQQDANRDLNKTIKDRYFASASATPSVIFPILLKLTQHHIAKSDYKYIAEKRISEIMNQINEFPSYLTLEKQGIFALGYYHQKVALFQKITEREK